MTTNLRRLQTLCVQLRQEKTVNTNESLGAALRRAEERLARGAFPVNAHAQMLGDDRRVRLFRRAIQCTVRDGDCVVDIGTGTGILAWYAAQCTTAPVVGIEAEGAACEFAEALLSGSNGRRPRIHRGFSFGRPLDLVPQTVISETLGPIGLEENIVEILWEFCRRYPSVERVIPADVTIYAQPVRSHALASHFEGVLAPFLRVGQEGPAFDRMLPRLREACAQNLFGVDVDDAAAAAPASPLAHFALGRTQTSTFQARMVTPLPAEYDGINLFFESVLAPGLALSTSCLGAATHWQTFFLAPHPEHQNLEVSYDAAARKYAFRWGE